jgi:hypothetical protein
LVTALVVLPTASSASVDLRTSRQARHFGDTAGVVGHRAEGVERDDHAGKTEHRCCRDRGAEQACELEGHHDAANDHDGRQRVASSETARPWITLVP